MRAVFNDAPFVEHHDLLGVTHGGKAMGGDDLGDTRAEVFEVRHDMVCRLCVHLADRIVEQQNRRGGLKGAGQGYALFLAAGEDNSALAHHCVEAVAKLAHIPFELGRR
jgi:hypothetical protein